MAYDELTAKIVRDIRELHHAATVLAEFAQTAPGRLPARVQEAVSFVLAPPKEPQ
jgi:hypothetical protein